MKKRLIYLIGIGVFLQFQHEIVFAKPSYVAGHNKVILKPDTADFKVIASATSSEKDFDFFIGNWKIKNKELQSGANGVAEWREYDATDEFHKILYGFGNTDYYRNALDGKPFEGVSLRIFNPETKLWSIYWVDNVGHKLGIPVTGSFDKGVGLFYRSIPVKGQKVIIRYIWDVTNPDNPLWNLASSRDDGKTWKTTWYMSFKKSD
jgi:hypothetical protein